jgi:hypothetical protein
MEKPFNFGFEMQLERAQFFAMIECPACHEKVNNLLLRAEYPKCSNEHDLGRWVSCANTSGEHHVFLEYKGSVCPYCSSAAGSGVGEGLKVKCLYVNSDGVSCITRPFLWIKEGPPCAMNHVGKMRLD